MRGQLVIGQLFVDEVTSTIKRLRAQVEELQEQLRQKHNRVWELVCELEVKHGRLDDRVKKMDTDLTAALLAAITGDQGAAKKLAAKAKRGRP